MGPFIIDLIVPDLRLAVDVHGHWHTLPAARERDQRRRARLEQEGYTVVVLTTDRMHLWWRDLHAACRSCLCAAASSVPSTT